jgi:hypothetical protein
MESLQSSLETVPLDEPLEVPALAPGPGEQHAVRTARRVVDDPPDVSQEVRLALSEPAVERHARRRRVERTPEDAGKASQEPHPGCHVAWGRDRVVEGHYPRLQERLP